MTASNPYSVTLKCGTIIDLSEVETAGISFLPCGQFKGQDQPLISFSHLLDTERQFKFISEYPNKAWIMSKMTGIQILTGKPTNKLIDGKKHYLLDVDIEKHLIDTHPDIVDSIVDKYKSNAIGNPFIVDTKSGGLRLSMFITKYPRKTSYKSNEDMFLEMFSYKGYSRLDDRYAIREGIITEIPHIDISFPQWINTLMKPISTKQDAPKSVKVEDLRDIDSKVDFSNFEWNEKGISQSFPKSLCKATEHKHQNANGVQYLKIQGRIDGYCHGCKSQWTEVNATFPKARQGNSEPTPVENLFEESEMLTALPTNEHFLPKFPDYEGELFIGAFQNLYLAYADTHVWSPEMLMAMGIASLSYIAGRHITVQTHENTKTEYLNSYILAVGESDLTAKSDAIREVKKHITHCFDDFASVSNALSLEGILKALSENDESRQYLMLDESSVVFTNSRREGTKNLLAGLNEIWICPPNYITVRAGEKTRIDYPFLNCWGNIPTQLIPAVFRQDDLISGTLNRWLPFYVSPKIKTERTPHAVTEFYDKWIKHLKSISVYKEARRFVFTEEADDFRFEWYDTLRQNAIKNGFQTGESRFHTHLVKLSGVFALADNRCDDDTVKIEHIENALSVIHYLFECYEFLFRNVGGTRLGDIENSVLDVLNQNGNEMTLTELGRKLRGTDSTERERVYEVLEKHGIIVRFQEKSGGRFVNKIRRIGE